MNFIYNLAGLLLFQFLTCNPASEFQQVSLQPDSLQDQKRDKTGTANIVFRSADNGETWQDISDGLPEPVKDDNSGGRNVFFTDDHGLWLTDGNGIYYSKPDFTAPYWTKAVFPDEHSSIAPGKNGIYAYHYLSGIFQKTTGTSVWSPVFPDFKEKRVRGVLETAGGIIFISTDKGLFKSTDSGKTWKLLPAGGLGGKMVESKGVLLTTGQQGIMRSTDEGESWYWVIKEGGVGIDVASIKGGFAAITYSTVSRTRRIRTSYDGGETWQAIDAGLQEHSFIDPILPPVNANLPVQRVSDSTWHPENTTIVPLPTYITTIIQVGENFFCGHSDGIYRSSDKGKTWKLVLPAGKGKMFKLSVSGNVIYGIQMENHC